ncbi:MAG: secretion system protein [Acidobacteria bacterium]|nr:MAG: secretion system protein [Acidobacteriota bacterium]
MVILFLISAAITVFLLVAALVLMLTSNEVIDARLMEVAAAQVVRAPSIADPPKEGLAQAAAVVTSALGPLRSLVSGSDEDLAYRLTLAGFRKSEHIEIYTALKMLLPVAAIIAGTFFASNMLAVILVGSVAGFFGPDLVLTHLISRRQESIRLALPDALDLLVICMEAGLGIDQAMVRVGEEIRLTSPALAEEFQIINREQRAGKVRLDAWRSMAGRVDIDYVRQFVTMLMQTERFGTPIANALGQFADSLRLRRTQAAEEQAAKTGVKLLFPLVLFIFPSILVVALGPAILGIQKMLLNLVK